MRDKGTCPYCGKEFEVDEYGHGLKCPNCQKKIDVFPDPVWVQTKWGTFGVSGNLLALIFKWGKN